MNCEALKIRSVVAGGLEPSLLELLCDVFRGLRGTLRARLSPLEVIRPEKCRMCAKPFRGEQSEPLNASLGRALRQEREHYRECVH